MNKKFKIYAICWAILFVLFNLICFITPSEIGGLSKYDATFWTAYALVDVAFIGQLIASFFGFKADTLKKQFYRVSLVSVSYTGLIVMLIAGAICMAVPNLPSWIAAVVNLIVLAITAIAVVAAKAAGDAVEKIDEKIKVQTFFIKSLTVDANDLVAKAKSDEIKKECEKVYEAVRYSDPMSNDALASAEAQITVKFNELADAVNAEDAEKVKAAASEVVILINNRNQKCKLLK